MKRIFAVVFCLLTAPLSAQQDHVHEPLRIRSRPVIERVPVQVIHPADVLINSLNETLVADSTAGMLFRIGPLGTVTTIGQDLKHVSRLSDSAQLGTYALIAESANGRITNFTDSGLQMDVAYLPFAPTGLAVDGVGQLYTADNKANRIVRVSTDGQLETFAVTAEAVRDLMMEPSGNIVALLESGRVISISAGHTTALIGFVSPRASRLRWHADGRILALVPAGSGKAELVSPTADREAIDAFATVPRGTTAFAVDKLGNLVLSNPDLRAVTRVNSRFRIPCPHCGESLQMILSPDTPPAEPLRQRSF
ncbi:MAG: hypothetical protein Fues2KO_44460 [Fuerstiella sp.]